MIIDQQQFHDSRSPFARDVLRAILTMRHAKLPAGVMMPAKAAASRG
jgi:hypothetical protein